MKENESPLFSDAVLGEVSLTLRRSVGAFMGNMGLIIAVLTMVATVFLFFTELSLAELWTGEFTLSMLVLLFCSYIMYFSMADTGMRAGRCDPSYQRAQEEFSELQMRMEKEGDPSGLRVFCRNYTEAACISAQKHLLWQAGISYEEFQTSYQNKKRYPFPKEMNRRARRAIRRADHYKLPPLTASMLLSGGKQNEKSNLSPPPSRRRFVQALWTLLPTTVSSFFAVSIVCSVMREPTLATLTECMLKLIALLWNGGKGYMMGYQNIVVDTVAYLRDRSMLLRRFFDVQAIPIQKNEQTPALPL